PESIPVPADYLSRLMPSPTFELLQTAFESDLPHLEEQMQMTRHDHEFEHIPFSGVAELDCFGNHLRYFGPLQCCRAVSSVKPGFHFYVNSALGFEPTLGLGTIISVLCRQFPNSIDALFRNCARKMDRDKVPTGFYLPVRKVPTPERNCLRLTTHGRLI